MKSSRQTFSAVLFSAVLLSAYSYSQGTCAGHKRSYDGAPGFYDHTLGSPVVDLIDQTRKTLEIEIYEMDDPKVIASIRKALKRGVKVRIIKEPKPVGATCSVFEPIGSSQKEPIGSSQNEPISSSISSLLESPHSNQGSTCEEQKQLVADVNATPGSQYLPFKKPDLCGGGGKNCLEHGKLVISDAGTDSKKAMLSTGNFNTSNLCDLDYSPKKCNREYSYLSDESDVVQSFLAIFEKDMLGESYEVNDAILPSAASKITVSPHSLAPLLTFIRSAKKEILIENQYLKDPTLNQALVDAAENGVSVSVILASACSFGKPKPSEVKKLTAIFSAFEDAGIQLRMFNKNIKVGGKPGYLHAKAIVVDGAKAWVGSVNGSTQALTKNREFGIFFETPSEVLKLASKFKQDFADPNEETWQESLVCKENH